MKTKNSLHLFVPTIWIILFSGLIVSCGTTKNLDTAVPQHISDSLAIVKSRKAAALFSDALAQRIAGNGQKALELFQQVLEIDPEDHASMYELSELYARKGMINESLTLMKQAVQLDPKNEWYYIRLAQLYKYTGNNQAYADVFKKLLELKPGSIEYYSELSNALVLLEKYDEAIEVFNEIEKQLGINEMLSLQKHNILLGKKDTLAAIHEIEKLSAAFPWETRYHAMLAELYIKYGPQEKALEHYQKILEIDPGDPYVNISVAEYYRKNKEEAAAFDALMKAFENPALDVETKLQVMLLWFDKESISKELDQKIDSIGHVLARVHPDSPHGFQILADLAMRLEHNEEALDYLLKAIEKNPNSYLVWESLLFVDARLDQYDSLNIHARQTILLFPEQPLPYYFRGIALYHQKEYEQALEVLERGRKFVVGNDRLLGEIFSIMGEIQHRLGNHIASDEAYAKALAINPANSIVLNNFAYYLSLRGEKLDQALEMSAKSIELDPGNASNLDTYAWILYKMNEFQSALDWIEQAIQASDTVSGTLWEHYGDILFKLDDKQQALEKWKQAKEAGNASELIDKKIQDAKLYE
ncbi:MAG: tetratricopeptide repeat protein [Bacteroidales bacterium]|nr:tetratricopeptide repeat protein [Bacteroidales bacterium]